MQDDNELDDKIKKVETELVMHGYLDGWNIKYLKSLLHKLKKKLNK